MRKLAILLLIHFRSLLTALSFGTTHRKKFSTVILLGLIGFGIVCASLYYCMIGGFFLREIGAVQYLFPAGLALSCLISFFLTFFCAGSVIFESRDMDLLFSLPIRPFQIMLSKILALYLQNLLFGTLFLAPAAWLQAYWQKSSGLWYWTVTVVLLLLTSFLPTFFSLLVGYVVICISAKMRHKALVENFLYLMSFAAILVAVFALQKCMANQMLTEQSFREALNEWLYPLEAFRSALYGNGIELIKIGSICFFPFLVETILFSKYYRKIYSHLSAKISRGNYQLGQVRVSSAFMALLRKELLRYFNCPTYVANTMFGAIFLAAGGIISLVLQSHIQIVLNQLKMANASATLLMIAAIFILSITCTTNVSISMEGKNLWILKEAPLPPMLIFKAKLAVQIILVVPAILLYGVCTTWAFQLSFFNGLELIAGCLCYSVFNALGGLIVNLLFPKKDCENDIVIVKQSASVMITSFGGLLLGLMIGAAAWYTQPIFSFSQQAIGLILASSLSAAGCMAWLIRHGAKRLQQI